MIFIAKDFCGHVATQYHEAFVYTSRLKWNILHMNVEFRVKKMASEEIFWD